MKRVFSALLLLSAVAAVIAAESPMKPGKTVRLAGRDFQAVFDRGRLDKLIGADSEKFVGGGGFSSAIEFKGKMAVPERFETDGKILRGFYDSGEFKGATLETGYSIDPDTGDLVFTQRAETPQGGLSRVRWCVGTVPLDWKVIVPNAGGMQITADTPDSRLGSAGPMFWEFPLVIYQNPRGGGFYVFSDTTEWPFTAVQVTRSERGFVTEITTENHRPFASHRTIESPRWRLNTFTGDWRVPAERIRKLWNEKFRAHQPAQPEWVRDIDLVVFDQKMDPERIEWLLKYYQIDPRHTLVYLSHWRGSEYDRDYPTYDKIASRALPFIEYLKSKGFRVMIHVNWFGCSPENPVHKLVEDALILNSDGSKKRYANLRKTPPIFIDYVNPASPVWRREFVKRVKQAVEATGADGVHLDQNQHCHNYDGTVIDGMSMIEGTLALHRELREAMPEVALSGEGSNGLTARYLAFAQRTIWSLTPQQVDVNDYRRYHPISNYIFGDSVVFYGWLGTGDPAQRGGQLYSAWRDGLSRIGVIPVMRTLFITDEKQLAEPDGYRKMEMAEISAITGRHLHPDYAGDWSEGVRMPWKSADGSVKAVMDDTGNFHYADGTPIGRTLIGVREFTGSGSIAGQYYYDSEGIYGLNPGIYYPLDPNPRDLQAFHIESLPPYFTVADVRRAPGSFDFSVVPHGETVFDLAEGFRSATASVEGPDGSWVKSKDALGRGELQKRGNLILMRPPARATGKTVNGREQSEGTGMMTAAWKLTLPEGGSRFTSGMTMHGNSLGNGASDGVVFRVEATAAGEPSISREYYFDCRGMELADNRIVPLELDLTPFAGKEIVLTLKLGAGPDNNATSDDAFWVSPRVERRGPATGTVAVVTPFEIDKISCNGRETAFSREGNRTTFQCDLPGKINISVKK